jgi:hypothetical protein
VTPGPEVDAMRPGPCRRYVGAVRASLVSGEPRRPIPRGVDSASLRRPSSHGLPHHLRFLRQ